MIIYNRAPHSPTPCLDSANSSTLILNILHDRGKPNRGEKRALALPDDFASLNSHERDRALYNMV